MGDVAIFVVMLLFFVFGVLLGYGVGHELGKRAQTNAQYWLYNLLAVAVGVALSAVVSAFGLRSVAGMAIGVIAGAIVGIKFGYGKSVGVWRRHDRAFRVNADQVSAEDSARAAAGRGQTEEQAASRELISVGGPGRGGLDKGAAGREGERRPGR